MTGAPRDADPLAVALVGQECDQIQVSRDVVEIGFSHWWLSCVASPVVRRQDAVWRFPEPGSCDALCSIIDSVVVSAVVDDENRLVMVFQDGALLSVADPSASHGSAGWRLEHWRERGA